jgi:hypothetical protein
MAQSLEHKTDRTSTRTFRMAKSQAKRHPSSASFAQEAETTASCSPYMMPLITKARASSRVWSH